MTTAEQGHKLHRIVIVGGGIGGLVTATDLARRLGRSGKAEVLLIDRNRAHVWKPMLHTFAAGTSDYANENVSFIPHAKLTGYKYWPGDSAAWIARHRRSSSSPHLCRRRVRCCLRRRSTTIR
jgi:NADH dehydrogenase